jgi:DNA-binding XRE family transcriptional regulator
MKKWTRAAMRFTRCQYLPEQGVLDVSFRNGDRFQVRVETVLSEPASALRWDRLRIGQTQDVLEIPRAGGVTEVPWDRIRCVADAAFRRHLAVQAAKSVRRVAHRLRELRQQRGLTQDAVARAAGVDRVTISRLENGALQPTFETLARVVAAMGARIQDIATQPVPV